MLFLNFVYCSSHLILQLVPFSSLFELILGVWSLPPHRVVRFIFFTKCCALSLSVLVSLCRLTQMKRTDLPLVVHPVVVLIVVVMFHPSRRVPASSLAFVGVPILELSRRAFVLGLEILIFELPVRRRVEHHCIWGRHKELLRCVRHVPTNRCKWHLLCIWRHEVRRRLHGLIWKL